MSADLALQKALRAVLTASAAVTALVPAASIIDRHALPSPNPCIVLGLTQDTDPGTSAKGQHRRLYHTLHVWVEEPSTEGAKRIGAAIAAALRTAPRPALEGGMMLAGWSVSDARYLREKTGRDSHGVITVDALIAGVA